MTATHFWTVRRGALWRALRVAGVSTCGAFIAKARRARREMYEEMAVREDPDLTASLEQANEELRAGDSRSLREALAESELSDDREPAAR